MSAGAGVAYASFRVIAPSRDGWHQGLAAGFAVYIFFGPLVGFWGITARPDMWSLVFEIAALALFWHFYPDRRLGAILLAALCAYLAWGLKNNGIFAAVAIGLFLLARRDWRSLAPFCVILWLAYGATFFIGGEIFTRSFFESARLGFNGALWAASLADFAVKFFPGLAALAAVLWAISRRDGLWNAARKDERLCFSVLGFAAIGALTLVASSKDGAAENYYFALSYFTALTVLVGLERLARAEAPAMRRVLVVSILGWFVAIAAIAGVLGGVRGVISLADQHARYMNWKTCLEGLEKPVYYDIQYLSLPWMNPSEPYIMLPYNYPFDRKAGHAFEAGGVGGLIEKGYFNALVLQMEPGATTHDGGRLDAYERRPGLCHGQTVFVKRPAQGGGSP
jgi:hypothetical protein